MEITLVVAHTENRVIGRDGGMPWHLPADLAHFKAVTMGKPMIMGLPIVTALKCARSAGRCQGMPPSRPMTRFSVWATTRVISIAGF